MMIVIIDVIFLFLIDISCEKVNFPKIKNKNTR